MKKIISFLTIVFGVFVFSCASFAKTFYLDGDLSSNCTSGNYSISNRDCSGSDGDAYNNLSDAVSNLVGGDTLYVREGTYIRTTNSNEGSLAVAVSGTASQHTIVSGYQNEQPVICTETGKCQYNPDPSQGASGNPSLSAEYYPNAAISISGDYIDVKGFKTYGMVTIVGCNNSSIQDSDLGGGGPGIFGTTNGQGQVIMIHTAYDILVKNNKIHNSCRATDGDPGNTNGSAVMGYSFAATIENNEFYDNWGSDIRLKDTQNMSGYTTIIRYNFFKPSSLYDTAGVMNPNQYADISYIYIYNNIFYNKVVGIEWEIKATVETVAYNNTFVNCDKDINTWMNQEINAYNNLYYHSSASQRYYDLQINPLSNLTSDYNLFYSLSTTNWYNLDANRGSTLSAWQSYSGGDSNSISVDPDFVNASGSNPEDFKRNSYTENFTGSSYGVHAGAYETGSETIGASFGSSSSSSCSRISGGTISGATIE